eukprot:3782372-Prymnesium_polylepis.1
MSSTTRWSACTSTMVRRPRCARPGARSLGAWAASPSPPGRWPVRPPPPHPLACLLGRWASTPFALHLAGSAPSIAYVTSALEKIWRCAVFGGGGIEGIGLAGSASEACA